MVNKKDKMPSTREATFLDILRNRKRYGREIRDEFEKRTKQRISLAAVYVTLSRMDGAGFVLPSMGEATPERGGHRRKYYEITGLGEKALDSFQEYVSMAIPARLGCVSG